ncbi:MAG: hypothetical protein AAGI23_12810 [Bacteroidota bacterium]
MKGYLFLALLVLVVFIYSCEEERPEKQATTSAPPVPALLIFKAEQQIEIWTVAEQIVLDRNIPDAFPIGVYDWQQIQLVNETDSLDITFLLSDKYTVFQNTKAYIFPNDARKNGQFHPCLRCPHSTAAVYSRLWLHLQDFQTPLQ